MKLKSNNIDIIKLPIAKPLNGENGVSEHDGMSGENGINGKTSISGNDGVSRKNGVTYSSGKSGLNEHNGVMKMDEHDRNVSWTDSEEDTDTEAEPVSASLVLKIVSEPPTPRRTPSKTSPAEEDYGYESLEPTETYLQVQVQRSTSTSSLCKPNCRDKLLQRSKSSCSLSSSRSRHYSNGSQYGPGSGSRHTSRETTKSGSLSPTKSDYNRLNSMNVVDLMNSVSHQTKLMQSGVRELRSEVENPFRNKLPGLEDEVIIFSGLNKQASLSLRNINNLYDETKYLKSYLEKLEAKVHYNMTTKQKCTTRPPWWRRLGFLGLVGFTIAFIMYRRDPNKLTAKAGMIANKTSDMILTFFTSTGRPVVTTVCLMGPGDT